MHSKICAIRVQGFFRFAVSRLNARPTSLWARTSRRYFFLPYARACLMLSENYVPFLRPRRQSLVSGFASPLRYGLAVQSTMLLPARLVLSEYCTPFIAHRARSFRIPCFRGSNPRVNKKSAVRYAHNTFLVTPRGFEPL